MEGKSPSRKVNEIDNRGSHFYLALYWAEGIAAQDKDSALAEKFAGLAKKLAEEEQTITSELMAAQGSPEDLGGYYLPVEERVSEAMRPSATLNGILADFKT